MEKQTTIASSCLFLLYIATFTVAEFLEAHHHLHKRNSHGSVKLFVFGDSYVDTSVAPSWKEPYGITFPGKPAGRFSNGHVLTDYIASFLGIRSPVPYALIKFVKKSKLKSGMNFAFGGTGVFDRLVSGPNLTTQIDFFEQLLQQRVYALEELNKETKNSAFVDLDLYNAFMSAVKPPKHHQGNESLFRER
ncbi:hypothetical protein ACE6H2_006820 [Prunus campanulata]